MPNYTNEQITKRASGGGKDAGRMKTADKLARMATEPPHDDDQAAMQQLRAFSGLGGNGPMEQTEGWATADARNYGKMKLAQLDPNYTASYDQANDGSFKPLHALGGALKFAAPFASLIPGVGIPLAAGLGAVGNSAGSLMKGEGFDIGGSLLKGGLAAGGSALLGGQGYKGLGGVPQRLGMGGGSPAMGNATQGMAAAAPTGGAPGGLISKLGGIGNIAKAGIAGAGILDSRAQRKAAERMANAQLGIRQGQLDMAEQDYASRAPLRNAALQKLGTLATRPMGSTVYGGSL
jgi:hypothetical protein